MLGKRYNKLVVLEDSGERYKNGEIMWLCQCDCGHTKLLNTSHLKDTLSCGCSKRKHGKASRGGVSPEYTTWQHMIQRCTNEKATGYKYYGAKGIGVCIKWFDFRGFLEDMGNRPAGTTLDRIDRRKGYYKENCRWANPKIQSLNKPIRYNVKPFENVKRYEDALF